MLIRHFAYSAALVLGLAQIALAEGAAVSFGGLKGDTTAQVEMNADTLTVSQADGTAVFSGNVVVSQGAMKLSANEVRVAYGADKTSIETLYATGKVLLVNATDAAQADNAVYTIASGEVVMTGNVLLTQGQAAMSAGKLVIDLKTGLGRMEGRVKTTFVPGKK
ncbi:organic solvent tolerance protein OstA [Cypionkella aquatica]|uniref:Organic solvent tolerance protein OstA n=1 Tax=Cypionkella aquatica TaxID=1756042 RepID=A0AA37TRB3_9RHOB|nr:LptA/OstA family protein [Cypionkella aquatica]GLS86167.1 organic solvent tolerance protein OstA [Cypionkella aquatica]